MAHSDGPVLALDDILRTMSPSPTPPSPTTHSLSLDPTSSTFSQIPNHPINNLPNTEDTIPPPRLSSPEPLDHSEVESMRARVQHYALSPESPNERESELYAMVLRLTSHLLLHPSPAQLASQAEAIADLTYQRNMLLLERSDDHARWQSEREQWDRCAEALLCKARPAQEPLLREQEMLRNAARLEDDVKTYRRRLSDTQTRLSTLESELSRLRPLLAMQATVLRDPELWRSEALSQTASERIATLSRKSKGKERAVPSSEGTTNHISLTNGVPEGRPEPALTHAAGVAAVPSATTSRSDSISGPSHHVSKHKSEKSHSHRKDKDRDRDKERRHRHRNDPLPLLADARAECILVAARKLGRVRAGVLSGLVKERRKLEREAHAHAKERDANASTSVAEQPGRNAPGTPTPAQLDPTPTPLDASEPPSSPSIPLASITGPGAQSTPRAPQRKLAPVASPFTRSPHLPTHLHPSMQAFAATTTSPSRVPTSPAPASGIAHPGFVYFVPGTAPAQSPVPSITPAPWLPPSPSKPAQAASGPAPAAPASSVGTTATPMDSLVSAARTLIEDEDYDAPAPPPAEDGEDEVDAEEGDTVVADADADADVDVDEPPPDRRTSRRRRAPALPPDSPAPKRRRTSSSAAMTATPPAQKATRRAKVAAAAAPRPSPAQEKPAAKPKGRPRGRPKAQQQQEAQEEQEAAPTPEATAVAASGSAARTPQPLERKWSALDVLAYQAAQEQKQRPSLGPRAGEDGGEADPGADSVVGAGAGTRGRGRGRGRGGRRGRGRGRGRVRSSGQEREREPEPEPEPEPDLVPETAAEDARGVGEAALVDVPERTPDTVTDADPPPAAVPAAGPPPESASTPTDMVVDELPGDGGGASTPTPAPTEIEVTDDSGPSPDARTPPALHRSPLPRSPSPDKAATQVEDEVDAMDQDAPVGDVTVALPTAEAPSAADASTPSPAGPTGEDSTAASPPAESEGSPGTPREAAEAAQEQEHHSGPLNPATPPPQDVPMADDSVPEPASAGPEEPPQSPGTPALHEEPPAAVPDATASPAPTEAAEPEAPSMAIEDAAAPAAASPEAAPPAEATVAAVEAEPLPPLPAATPPAPSVDPVAPAPHVRAPSPGLPPAPPPERRTPEASTHVDMGIESGDEDAEGSIVDEEED